MEAAVCSDSSNQLSDDTRATFQIMGQIKRLKNNSDNGGSLWVEMSLSKYTNNNTPKSADWREGKRKKKKNRCESLLTYMCVFWWGSVDNFFFNFLQFNEIMCYS